MLQPFPYFLTSPVVRGTNAGQGAVCLVAGRAPTRTRGRDLPRPLSLSMYGVYVRRSYPCGQSGQQGSNGTFSSVPMGDLLGAPRLEANTGPQPSRPPAHMADSGPRAQERDAQATANRALKPITQRSVHANSALNRLLFPARAALTSSRISPLTPMVARTVASARIPSSSTSRHDTARGPCGGQAVVPVGSRVARRIGHRVLLLLRRSVR